MKTPSFLSNPFKAVVVFSLALMLLSCNTTKETSSGSVSKAISGEPNVYCTVVSEPDPDLFGHWIGQNKIVKGEAWFGKKNGKYAFFYKWQRLNSSQGNAKWRPNRVDGNTITNPEGLMKFWVEDGVLYSQFKNEPITTFERVGEVTHNKSTAIESSLPKKQLTGAQLLNVLKGGKVLQLGGPTHGYHGILNLAGSGTGDGWAITDSDRQINIQGTWEIRDNQFCRIWEEVNRGEEVCEQWFVLSANTVEVYANGKKIGVNSWN